MPRPAIFLDTNICSCVANHTISPKEWSCVWKRIKTQYRYCISYVTQSELLVKLARGAESYFSRNKYDLNVLYGQVAHRTFLAYPPAFVIEKVFGLVPRLPRKEPSDFKEQLEDVLRASSKEELLKGVRRPNSTLSAESFDLDGYATFETTVQARFTNLLESRRSDRIDPPNRQKMSACMLTDFDLTPFGKHCTKLTEALDASYRYSECVAAFAGNSNYNFEKKVSNYQDCLQLMYLSDESMHFLTRDTDFKGRTEGSPQAQRILMYEDFLRTTR